MAHPRIHSPPSLGEPLVTLKSSGLQGVVSWLHSVVRGFASNLEAEKQQWESQAQELRGETRDLRRRLETLEGSSLPDARHDSTESGDLAEQMRALERRVDLWREEQLLRREMETGDVSKSAAAAPVDASYVEAMKQDLRESFESLLEDKVQTLQLSLQQRLGDTGEELSQLLQVHAASMGERLRICEERIAALAFGALQAPSEAADSEPKEEQRRPGSTGSGASNAGGASLESRVARLERNVKGLAAFASTSDAQRMDDLAMTVKQAQLDSRRCTERIQQLEAHAHQASQPDSQLLQMIKDLEQRIREEMQELKQEVENKISSEEKMDRGILEEVHRDLLSPVAPSSKSLGLGGFDLDFPAKPQTPSTAEVASLHTKMQVMAEQQDDRALHLDQELKKLQQQLFEVQVGTATTATGGDSTAVGDNGSKAASALAGTLAKHEEELKNLSASVSALQASVGQAMSSPTRSQDEAGRRVEADSPGDATSLTLALQKAEEAQRRVASLQTEVSRLAEAVEALRAEAKLSDQDREQLRVPEGLDKETLQDVRDDLLGLDTKEEKPENEVPDVADVADAADAELVKPQASSGEKPALEKPTEPAAASSEALPGEEALAERVASLEQKVSSLDESLQTLTEKVSPASDAPSSGADDPRVKDDTSPVPEGLEADALQRLKELETKVAELAQKTAGETPPAQVAEEASAEAEARPEASPETKPEATADAVPEAAPETEAPEVTAAAEVRPGVEPDSAAHEEIAKLWKEVQKLSEAVADLQKEAESKEIHPPGEDDEEAGSNPLDELKQEVSTLSGNLVALQDSQGTLQEEVKRLAAAMESDQVSKLAEEVQSLRRHVDDGEPQVANLMEELQSLRQHLDEGEPAQKVESLAETLKQLQESHHDLHQKVENVGTREAEVSDLKKQVQSLGDTVTRTVEAVSARNESLSEVPKLKEALESLKRRQEEFNLQIEATQRKQLNAIREDMRVVQASQEAAAKRQAQIKEGTQSLEKEQLQLASKLRQLENGRLKQLGQDMQVVKEAILHVQQELKKEVVIPEHILKDLDDKNEARLEAIWKELHSHAEAAATRADRIEQSLTQRVVHLESATTRLVKAEEHTRSLEQDMQKQSEWFAWRIAWLEWATTGEKRSFARALLPPPSTPAATCFKQPLTEDSELWAQEKAGPRRLRRAPLHNMPNAGTANGSALSGSSSAPDLQATGKGQGTRLPDLR